LSIELPTKPHVRAKPELLIMKLRVHETKNEHMNMLYDSSSTISLMKLKYLKDNALIYENKIALTGITGHKVHTLGKVYVTITIEHDGILGIDFLRKHPVKCDFQRNKLRITDAVMKLYPFSKTILKPPY